MIKCAMSAAKPLIWVLTDDRPGTAAQVLGVAEALAQPYQEKPLRYGALSKLPNFIQGGRLIGLTPESRTTLAPPWPDLILSAGRRAAPVARWIKQQTAGKARAVHIMNPGRAAAADFDLIAVPEHDCTRPDGDAPNELRITGAPHRFTPLRRNAEAAKWRERIAALPKPWIALLVGGATRQRPFEAARARDLAARVAKLAKDAGGSILAATSRRTGREAEDTIASEITGAGQIFRWSEGGDNPYFGYLALADTIVVTGDSVSMCSEACASESPVYIYAPDGMVAPKHARLHAELYRRGLARPLGDRLDKWSHPPLNAATDVARAIERLMAEKR